MTHHILFYDYVENAVERRAPYRDEHLALAREQRDAGRLVMAGAIGDPPHGGVLVFRDLEPSVIEEFVQSDPYVKGGVVTAWRIEPWNVVIAAGD
jgi:uncharacterized protein YciI